MPLEVVASQREGGGVQARRGGLLTVKMRVRASDTLRACLQLFEVHPWFAGAQPRVWTFSALSTPPSAFLSLTPQPTACVPLDLDRTAIVTLSCPASHAQCPLAHVALAFVELGRVEAREGARVAHGRVFWRGSDLGQGRANLERRPPAQHMLAGGL